jgi:hypothetical protein
MSSAIRAFTLEASLDEAPRREPSALGLVQTGSLAHGVGPALALRQDGVDEASPNGLSTTRTSRLLKKSRVWL